MSDSLEDRIKDLERQLALKQAYLNVSFSFPKNSKIPEDVRSEVTAELKSICAGLAEGKEQTVAELNPNTSSYLTSEEISTLKSLAEVAKGRLTPAASRPQPIDPPKKVVDSGVDGVKKARLLTLENLNVNVRSKIEPMEEVWVKSSNGEMATIATKKGIITKVPVEDLDFNS